MHTLVKKEEALILPALFLFEGCSWVSLLADFLPRVLGPKVEVDLP